VDSRSSEGASTFVNKAGYYLNEYDNIQITDDPIFYPKKKIITMKDMKRMKERQSHVLSIIPPLPLGRGVG